MAAHAVSMEGEIQAAHHQHRQRQEVPSHNTGTDTLQHQSTSGTANPWPCSCPCPSRSPYWDDTKASPVVYVRGASAYKATTTPPEKQAVDVGVIRSVQGGLDVVVVVVDDDDVAESRVANPLLGCSVFVFVEVVEAAAPSDPGSVKTDYDSVHPVVAVAAQNSSAQPQPTRLHPQNSHAQDSDSYSHSHQTKRHSTPKRYSRSNAQRTSSQCPSPPSNSSTSTPC